MTPRARHHRSTLLLPAALAVLLLAPLATAAPRAQDAEVVAAPAAVHDHASHDHGGSPEVCEGEELVVGGAVACVHEDEPPPGVDVTDPVGTAEARSRTGAEEAAVAAAEDEGVVGATTGDGVTAAAAASEVPCDGDGTSGYRVQAMYVVAAGRPNRYSSLVSSIQTWAAGADAVVNRSAALTGGVRSVRYVHAPGTSGCTPSVLNVTVPAGADQGFGATIDAVRAAGYTSPTRKYLMWVDASVLCGVGTMYLDDQPGQANANNGRYAQYARVDSGCWGYPQSVEAHELVHTLGGVQRSAPNSTAAGHCTDESDRMCYVDGAGVVMRQVCASAQEYLLDCNADDYFSTLPTAGSYLAGRWNSADSRFLIGGGDGSGGGSQGSPTTVGVSVQLNNPAVPGLPTQASAVLQVPTGRTAAVAWTTSVAGCLVGSPGDVQTSITCPATTTAPVTVTVTATDSAGARAVASGTLTFATTTRRTARVAVDVAGATSSHLGCTGAAVPVSATVVDVATGLPVLGVAVDVRRRTATTTATTVGTAPTSVAGVATVRPTIANGQLYGARTRATGPFDLVASTTEVAVSTTGCASAVTLEAGGSSAWTGDRVTFSGTATSTDPAGKVSPVAGGTVTLLQLQSGSTTLRTIGSTRTGATGGWTLPVAVLASGPVRARLSAGPGYATSDSVAVQLAATPTVTRLAGTPDALNGMWGRTLRVGGTLQRDAGGTSSPVAGAVVQLVLTRTGTTTATVLAKGTTATDGSYALTGTATAGGTLDVRFAGTTVQPAARTGLGTLSVTSWTTATTLAASTTSVPKGTALTASGAVVRSSATAAEPAPAVPVKVYLLPAAGGAEQLLGSTTTRTDGSWSLAVRPGEHGSLRARVVGVVGYRDSVSTGTSVQVAASVTAAPSTRTPRVGVAFTVGTTVGPAQAATVRLEQQVGTGAWTTIQTAVTSSTGAYRFTVSPGSAGARSYRVRVDATARTAAATSPAAAVTVGP